MLFETHTANTTIVTATQRLTRYITAEFNQYQQALGLSVWETPAILPWSSWLQRLWYQYTLVQTQESHTLLSPHQELLLWEQVIGQYSDDIPLLQAPATAKMARQAWQLQHEWCLDLSVTTYHNHDITAYLTWSQAYQQRLAEHRWIDRAQLTDVIWERMSSAEMMAPKVLVVAGFDDITTQQQRLLDGIDDIGSKVVIYTPEKKNQQQMKMVCQDSREELRTVAQWIRSQVTTNPQAQIGVVVPNLSDMRQDIENVFDDVLIPALHLPGASVTRRPYAISAALPLLDYAIIRIGLFILELHQTFFSYEKVRELLRSPFIGGSNEEFNQRAMFDNSLSDIGEMYLSLSQVIQLAQSNSMLGATTSGRACPRLVSHLKAWEVQYHSLPNRQTGTQWARSFMELLNAFGWPGDRSLDSREYQTIQAFYQVFSQLAAIDMFHPSLSYHEAVVHFRSLLQRTNFEIEAEALTVNVMGTLEATGVEFDALWVVGLHDGVWPESAKPNPFLPLELQRQANVPHSSPERQQQFTQRIHDRLLNSATLTICSYPAKDGDQVLRESPLLKNVAIYAPSDITWTAFSSFEKSIFLSKNIEQLSDFCGPPLASLGRKKGGTSLFKDQAACPFKAFATHRLGARNAGQIHMGLNSLERGDLLHIILEKFWKLMVSQENLQSFSEQQIEDQLQVCVEQVIDAYAKQKPNTFTRRFKQIEIQRLTRLVSEFIQLEKQRSPFVVQKIEQDRMVNIGLLNIKTKVDRIDVLPDDSWVIIDYKTSEPSPTSWFGERPDEPQLPLYAVTEKRNVSGLIFAQVKSGKVAYKGIVKEAEVFPGMTAFIDSRYGKDYDSWEALTAHWQQILDQLAEQYQQGIASVDPKNPNTTCAFCDLTALCRINELNQQKQGFSGETQNEDDVHE